MGRCATSVAAIALLTLPGCIVIPSRLPEADPYREEIIEPIQLGETRMAEVVDYLGDPDRTLGNDRWLLYEKEQRGVTLFLLVAYGYYAGGQEYKLDDVDHFLLINFNSKNIAKRLEVLTENKPCNSDNSICYSDGIFHIDFDPESVAHSFPQNCSIFLYSTNNLRSSVRWSVDYKHYPIYWTDNGGVIHLALESGPHLLQATEHRGGQAIKSTYEFNCDPNDPYWYAPVPASLKEPLIRHIDIQHLRHELEDKRLLLNPGTTFGNSILLSAPHQWPTDRLCQVSNKPEEYVFGWAAESKGDRSSPTLDIIRAEAANRNLDCSPLRLAKAYCESTASDEWPAARCTSLVEPIERAGPGGFGEMNDQQVCELVSQVEKFGKIDQGTKHRIGHLVDFDQEIARRSVSCAEYGILLRSADPDHEWILSGLELIEGSFYEAGHREPFTGHRELRRVDGSLLRQADFVDGLIHGTQTVYDSRGIKQTFYYEHGVPNGVHQIYYKSGPVRLEEYLKDGQRHGLQTRRDRDGRITRQYCYQDGRLVDLPPNKCPN
jgi:hypothetical protein